MTKILILRMSSIGDILQCLGAVEPLQKRFPEAEIHWVVRSDLRQLVEMHPHIKNIFDVNRAQGIFGLFSLAQRLSAEKFTHVYDAHNNLRSHLLTFLLWIMSPHFLFIRKSKDRMKRLLLFRFRFNLFSKPYRGRESFILPLKTWGVKVQHKNVMLRSSGSQQRLPEKFVVLVPSAAWPLKVWPLEHWKKLIRDLAPLDCVVLGGKSDLICDEIAAGTLALNLRGQLDFKESAYVIEKSQAVISGDTSLFHMADLMGHPALVLMGPTPFGYPSSNSSSVAEVNLECRPCSKDGRGRCRNSQFKKCMEDIRSADVLSWIQGLPRT